MFNDDVFDIIHGSFVQKLFLQIYENLNYYLELFI